MPIGYTTAKPIKTKEKCSYGCGQQAKFIFKNEKLCCSEDFRQCPGWGETMREVGKGRTSWNKGIPPGADTKTKIGLGNKGKKAVLYANPVMTTALCDYGCGKVAKFVFSNGKACCCTDYKACVGFIEKLNKIKKEKYPKRFENIGVDEWTFSRVKEIIKNEHISVPVYIRHIIYEDLKKRLQLR